MDLEYQRVEVTKTVMELRRRFFQYHTDTIKKPKCSKPVKVGLDPTTLVLNPEQFPQDEFSSNTWYAVYCKGYFVTIEQSVNNPIRGPHVAKLYIQLERGRSEWLGTEQFDCGFFSESDLRIRLRRTIRLRGYFCSEDTELMEVVIRRGGEIEERKFDPAPTYIHSKELETLFDRVMSRPRILEEVENPSKRRSATGKSKAAYNRLDK